MLSSFLNKNKVFIIAEMSANHNGSLKTALQTIKAAKRAGADAIKIQTYTADTITLDCDNEFFQIKNDTLWDGETLYSLYQKAYTPWEWHKQIFNAAKDEGLICFSSPFDFTAVDLLEELECPIYKIASFEITDIPLIEYVASKGKPIIISTGIACEDDIDLAVKTCRKVGNNKIALLQCTSAYPAKIEDANLSMITDITQKYNVVSGLSDHSMGSLLPILSVAFGAKIIEKHFILDRSIGGADAAFSMNEKEFSEMVKSVRDAEKATGKIDYSMTDRKTKSRIFSRSLFVSEDIKSGELITEDNVKSVRPGNGLHPKYYIDIIGQKVNRDLEKGTPLSLNYIRK